MAAIQERKSADGKIKYRALIRLKGFPPQSATFERKNNAKKWLQDTESAIRDGRYCKTAEAKKHTVTEFIDRYSTNVLPQITKNIQSQKNHIRWWKKKIGHYLLSDVSSASINQCRDKLLDGIIADNKKRCPSTVSRYMTTMSYAMNIALKEREWIELNPFFRIKKQKEPRGRVRFLDDDERERLIAACKIRKVDYPLVFSGSTSGKPIHIRNAWDAAIKEAKIDDFHFHDLRHTTASDLAINGATRTKIAEVLGHKTLQLVKRYAHLSEAHTSSIVAKMNNKIFS
jgi:integrase